MKVGIVCIVVLIMISINERQMTNIDLKVTKVNYRIWDFWDLN